MKHLLEALGANTPSKRLRHIAAKTLMTNACIEIMNLAGAASVRAPMISTTEVFIGLLSTREELSRCESGMKRGGPINNREFNSIVRLLGSKPLALELPRPAVPDNTDNTDDTSAVAATTEEEDSDGLPDAVTSEGEGEEAEDSAALTVDVERAQPPTDADAPDTVKQAFDLIMGCPSLRKKLRFDLAPFLLRVYKNINAGLDASQHMQYGIIYSSETAKMFGGGRTQARKTPLKLCAFILCRMMGVCTIVLTTNVSGREDLFAKFVELLGDISVPTRPATIPSRSNDPQYRYFRVKGVDAFGRESSTIKLVKQPAGGGLVSLPGATALAEGVIGISDINQSEGMQKWASVQLSQGACLIVHNVAAAIYKARRMISTARGMCLEAKVAPIQFMLTIDEADDFYRTDGGEEQEIKMEEQLRELREIGPLVQFEVRGPSIQMRSHCWPLLATHRSSHRSSVHRSSQLILAIDPRDRR